MNREYLIKWQRKDYSNLKKAVNQFNKKIKEFEKIDKDLILPDIVNYQDLKSDIVTRKQLNQTINSLNRIKFKSALDEIELASGEKITRWEYQDVIRKQPKAIEKIQKDLEKEYNNTFKGLKNDRIIKLENTLKTLNNYQNKEGASLKYALDRIKKIGQVDYEMKKAKIFKDNFLYALKEGAVKFKNYKLFYNDLKKIKNPKEFYEYVKDSDTLMDLFTWYDDETGTLKYGAFKSNEDAFNNALVNDFGYILDE